MMEIDRLLCRATTACASPPAMLVVAAGIVAWIVLKWTVADTIDAILSGGALLFGQAIYRGAEPRDVALHAKLDELIHVTDADDALAGSEET